MNFIEQLSAINEETRTRFGGLDGAALNFKPSADAWSVGQCFEHLILTNDNMLSVLMPVVEGRHRNSFFQQWSPFTKFFGSMLIKVLRNDAKKAKAPSPAIVPPSTVAPDIIEKFVANNEKVADAFRRLEGADIDKTVVSSPFLKVMTYSVRDGMTALVEHERRHFRQAERVTAIPGFPAASEQDRNERADS
jgi:hypothetical protein